MHSFRVPPKSTAYPSKDLSFRIAFSAPLNKTPPRLSREGYIRALELYGREDILLDCLKSSVTRWQEWRNNNPGELEIYRKYANALGYDWERGTVTAEGLYTSHVLPTITLPNAAEEDSLEEDSLEISPGLPRNISQFVHVDDTDETAGEEFMARDANGRFAKMNLQQANTPNRRTRTRGAATARSTSASPIVVQDLPTLLTGAPGNLHFVPGEDTRNALGAAGLLHISLTILRGIVQDTSHVTSQEINDIKTMLEYLGPKENIEQFVKSFQNNSTPLSQNRFAPFAPINFSPSVQRNLFPLAETPRKRSRFMEELEEEEEAERSIIARQPRREEERPYICVDQVGADANRVDFAALYVGMEAIPVPTENIAQSLGKFHESVVKEAGGAVTLSQSMGMLGISSGAIIQLNPHAMVVKDTDVLMNTLRTVRGTPALATLPGVKQLLKEAGQKYDDNGWSPTISLMPEIVGPPTTTRQSDVVYLNDLLISNGRAVFNAPVEHTMNGRTKLEIPVANIINQAEPE